MAWATAPLAGTRAGSASSRAFNASTFGAAPAARTRRRSSGGMPRMRGLHGVELGDTGEGVLGDRRGPGGGEVEELAADVGPAGGLEYPGSAVRTAGAV